MATTADAVVVGAGVLGSAIALELARAGRRTVVIDMNGAPGAGSTSASSAIVRFNYSTLEGVVVAWEAKQRWAGWADHLGYVDPAGMAAYRSTGGLILGAPRELNARVATHFDALSISHADLDARGLRDRFPYLDPGCYGPPKALTDPAFWSGPDGELTGFFTPEGGYVDDPALAAHNLFAAAVVAGAEPMLHRRVVEVRRRGDAVDGVVVSDGSLVSAPLVVNAAGPHSAVLNRIAGVGADFRVRTRPLRQEVFAVAGPPAYTLTPGPFVADLDMGIYFRPTPGGDVLVGGLEPECDPMVWVDDPDGLDPRPTVAAHEAQVTRLARRMSDLGVPQRPRGVVGLYDVSDDWIPVYDRTGLDGYYVSIGTSGNQFKNAPVVGEIMRTLIEACEAGADHDTTPARWVAPHTGVPVDLGHYSRRRAPHAQSSYSVLG